MVSRHKQIVPRWAAAAVYPRRFWWKPRCSGEKRGSENREREREMDLRNRVWGCPLAQERRVIGRRSGSSWCTKCCLFPGLKGSLGTSGSLEPHKHESRSVSPHAGAAPITFSLFCATGSLFYISQTLQLLLSAEPRESGDFKAARQGFFSPRC